VDVPDGARAALTAPAQAGLELRGGVFGAVRISLRNSEETGVTQSDRLTLDRGAQANGAVPASPATAHLSSSQFADARDRVAGERAARRTLRAQVGRLERELSAIVAERFPYISASSRAERAASGAGGEEPSCPGPALLGLDQLERTRDRLAARLQELRRLAAERDEHERLAHEQLELMKLEPGRFRHVSLPVSDLGQGGCGVWHVRPRLGLIGMLAGWWQLKLSSGCPLPRGSRPRRGPGWWS
jgi:hypothetical protein